MTLVYRRPAMAKFKKFFADEEFEKTMDEAAFIQELLKKETDRGCALVAGAALEQVLGGLLTAFFVNDDNLYKDLLHNPTAPISTFSARIRLCRGLGLLSEDVYHDLETVRYVRNQAAHFDKRKKLGFNFSFARQDIADRCSGIRSFPADLLQRFSARRVFEIFVGMSAACIAEHAILNKVMADNAGETLAREFLYELVPKMNLKGHIRKVFKKQFVAMPAGRRANDRRRKAKR